MILRRLLGRKTHPAGPLYRAIVTAARHQRFYAEWAVPDTVDGRFDMIVLHLFLVLNRLRNGKVHERLSQDLTDAFFDDMDRSLREMGVGDLSVGKKVRKMAEACYGRLAAYEKAMEQNDSALELALERNVYAGGGGKTGAAPLAAWMKTAHQALAGQSAGQIAGGEISWP